MSMLELFKKSFSPEAVTMSPSRTKMVSKEKVVNGVLVDDYEFVSTDVDSDERNNVHYQDLCLSNLKRLGVLDKQQQCMLQRDDVDLVVSSLENIQNAQSAQTPAQNPQA